MEKNLLFLESTLGVKGDAAPNVFAAGVLISRTFEISFSLSSQWKNGEEAKRENELCPERTNVKGTFILEEKSTSRR